VHTRDACNASHLQKLLSEVAPEADESVMPIQSLTTHTMFPIVARLLSNIPHNNLLGVGMTKAPSPKSQHHCPYDWATATLACARHISFTTAEGTKGRGMPGTQVICPVICPGTNAFALDRSLVLGFVALLVPDGIKGTKLGASAFRTDTSESSSLEDDSASLSEHTPSRELLDFPSPSEEFSRSLRVDMGEAFMCSKPGGGERGLEALRGVGGASPGGGATPSETSISKHRDTGEAERDMAQMVAIRCRWGLRGFLQACA